MLHHEQTHTHTTPRAHAPTRATPLTANFSSGMGADTARHVTSVSFTCHLRHVRSDTTSSGNPAALYTPLQQPGQGGQAAGKQARGGGGQAARAAATAEPRPLSCEPAPRAARAAAARGSGEAGHTRYAGQPGWQAPSHRHRQTPIHKTGRQTHIHTHTHHTHLYLETSILATTATSARSVATRSPA